MPGHGLPGSPVRPAFIVRLLETAFVELNRTAVRMRIRSVGRGPPRHRPTAGQAPPTPPPGVPPRGRARPASAAEHNCAASPSSANAASCSGCSPNGASPAPCPCAAGSSATSHGASSSPSGSRFEPGRPRPCSWPTTGFSPACNSGTEPVAPSARESACTASDSAVRCSATAPPAERSASGISGGPAANGRCPIRSRTTA